MHIKYHCSSYLTYLTLNKNNCFHRDSTNLKDYYMDS